MFCKFCGHQMPDYVGRCPSCGKNVRGDVESGSIVKAPTPPKTKKTPSRFGLLAFVLTSVVLVGVIIYGIIPPPPPPPPPSPMTVEAYTQQLIGKMKGEVAEWARTRPAIVTEIERRHVSVKIDAVDLKSLKVNTIDNSPIIAKQLKNVDSVELTIRFWWDGVVKQNGHTDIKYTLVPDESGKFEPRKYDLIESDAPIDIKNLNFWMDVGQIGYLLYTIIF